MRLGENSGKTEKLDFEKNESLEKSKK